MATLGELKARIADEILKRNLGSQIASHISRAIEHYAGRRFSFNTGRQASTVTASNQNTALTGVRLIDKLWVDGREIRRACPSEIEEAYSSQPTASGRPDFWDLVGSDLRFYPIPATAYALVIEGVFDQPALSSDAHSNAWTNEAADLIAARCRFTLYRDVLRDTEGAALAESAMKEADGELQMKTMRRVGRGRVRGYL